LAPPEEAHATAVDCRSKLAPGTEPPLRMMFPLRLRSPPARLSLALLLSACATSRGPAGHAARPAGRAEAEPTPDEAAMLDELVQHRSQSTTHLRSALIVGGAHDHQELEALAANFSADLDRVVSWGW
jgi:hypothetical protein